MPWGSTSEGLPAVRFPQRAILVLFLLAALLILSGPSSALSDQAEGACESAEDCFRAAVTQVSPANGSLGRVDRAQLAIGRLKELQEKHAGSVWARRAGLLMGLLLSERDPAAALLYLRAAQRDFPVLEDYVRLWMAEAWLKTGEAVRAAALFEYIPEAVPDTLLANRVAYRGGEAWYRADQCQPAMELLGRAIAGAPQDPSAPAALMNLADCQLRDNRSAEGLASLRQVWVRYPQAPEAREASLRLARIAGEASWRPSPDDQLGRALSFLNLSLHEEAVEALQKFLASSPTHPNRSEARLKLGTALVRLKRYEQARQVFHDLAAERLAESDEAAVWLARVYLRQGEGEKLLALPQSLPSLSLSGGQKAAIHMLGGLWLEDQSRYDQALARYRQVARNGEGNGQRTEALWRIGWIHYRTGHLAEARETFQELLTGKEDGPFALAQDGQIVPQVLYWLARTLDRQQDRQAAETYLKLCRQYPFTYYGQLAQHRTMAQGLLPVSVAAAPSDQTMSPTEGQSEARRDLHYQKAVELKLLGLDQEAARELAWLIERYSKDRVALIDLSALLSEAGAYYHALRVARVHFRDSLEQGGDSVPWALWGVAYPTVYLPTIRAHAGGAVDPYLVAAIIREESQYDARAVSRVGAVGLMQVMPATAQAVAKKQGFAEVGRDELFDQETNIRVGVRYLDQLLQQFSGNVMQAVAAYNAGPQAVAGWIEKNGGKEPDEFVEMIPYQETRQYVKRVLRSYREYHRLGGNACAVRVLDKVC
jgi:soluble lytic murein transglycosylase